jgi:hypothetical protein
MRALLALMIFPLAVFAAEPAVRAPKKPVEIGTIELTDGRVLDDAAVVGDTARTITIRHNGTVEKIEKELLPENVRKRWPVDPVRAAAEDKAAAQEVAKKERAAQVKANKEEFRAKRAAEEAAWQAKLAEQRKRDNAGSSGKVMTAGEVEVLRRDLQAQDLLLCRDSVRILNFGYWDARNAVLLRVRNPSDNHSQLAWRELRALTSDGRVLQPLDVIFDVADRASYDVDRGTEQTFKVVFPSASIAAVSWSDRPDLGWIDPQGKVVTVEGALAAARERAIAAQKAKRTGKLQPVEGQIVQK